MGVTERSYLSNALPMRFRTLLASPRLQPALTALLVSAGYYLGAQLGFALDFPGTPFSIFWPPNAILMAALILAPARRWWLYLLAIFPAHLIVQLQNGEPIPSVLGWYMSNSSEALIGALGMRFFIRGRPRLDSLRQAVVFLLSVVIAAPFLSSFLDAGVVVLTGRGNDYWYLWRVRILSNTLTNLALVPVLLTWGTSGVRLRRNRPRWRYVEAGVLALTLVIVSALAFGQLRAEPSSLPALLYAPLPVLLWAAVRFGPIGAASGLVYVALVSAWNAVNDRGPFATLSPAENILSLRLFLIAVSVPIIFLAATLKERQRAEAALQQSEADLKQSEERFRRAVLDAPIPIMIHAEDGEVLQLNHAWTELTGYDRSELTTIDEWTKRAYGARAIMARQAMKKLFDASSRLPEGTDVVTTRNGERRTWEFSSAPLGRAPDGRRMIVSMAIDVTEREEAYQLLEQRVAERTAALGQANTQLEDAKVRAEAANQAKSRFLATISHELRTPLHAIIGFTHLLVGSRALAPSHAEYVAIIERNGEHLLNLINSVLDLSRLEAAQMTLDETILDLDQLLSEIATLFRLRTANKRLTWRIDRAPDLPGYVRVDATKLRQVLINLLGNALKFTTEGQVRLRVRAENQLDATRPRAENRDDTDQSAVRNLQSTIVFEVADTGPGVAPAEQERIFDAFAQVQVGAQALEGTGLGLAISRQFVELMGGRLTLSSAVGRGSTFTIAIPVEVVAPRETTGSPAQRQVVGLAPGQPRYRVLVVDARGDYRKLLVALLAPLGLDIREAADGPEALSIWQAWRPHLIWIDLGMSLLDGSEVAGRIKAEAAGRGPVIIALTASNVEGRDAVMASSCDDIVHEPFRADELFAAMSRQLGLRYIYDQAAGATPGTPAVALRPSEARPAPQALAALPAGLLAELERGARETDPALLAHVIAQTRAYDAPLADVLAALTDEFAYGQILASIQAARGDYA